MRPNTPQAGIEYLKTLDPDQHIAMMVVLQSEVEEVAGQNSSIIPRLTSLISRSPEQCSPGLDSNYWYEHRKTFRNLLEEGVEYLKQEEQREEVNRRNQMLERELNLKNFSLSVDKEIRPLAQLLSEDDLTQTRAERILVKAHHTNEVVVLSPRATWVDLLRRLDRFEELSRPYFEGLEWQDYKGDGEVVAYVHWGS